MECYGGLRQDHEIIREAVRVFVAVSVLLAQGRPVADADVDRLLRFGDSFVDRLHHVKEETALFPAIESSDLGPRLDRRLDALRADHASARSFMVAARGQRHDPAILSATLMGWARLMQAHTAEEDECVFPLLGRGLDRRTQEGVLDAFAKLDERAGPRPDLSDLSEKYSASLALPYEVACMTVG